MENTFVNSPDVKEIFQCMDFYAKYPQIRLFSGKVVYALHEKVRTFFLKNFDTIQKKQTAHSNFLWRLIKYYSTPFQKEAVALVNAHVKELDLDDKNKLGYLNYILSSKVYPLFHDSFFAKLAQVDLSSDTHKLQARHIFLKMKTRLEKKQNDKVAYVALFNKFSPFFSNLAQQSKRVPYKMLGEFAEVYFNASSHHEYKNISPKPLLFLLQNTSALQERLSPQLFEQEFSSSSQPQIDKQAVTYLLNAYCDYAEKQDKKTPNLHHAMTAFFCDIVRQYDYSATDVKNLRKLLGKKYTPRAQKSYLYDMGLALQKAYNQTHTRGITSRHKTVQDFYKNSNSRWD